MPSDITRLTRRVDHHDQDLRAVSDTVIEIKENLDQLRTVVDHHGEVLDHHSQVLDQHTGMLTEILRRLEPAAF